MKLNDRQIKNAKPAEKPFKLNDGKGLYLYINTSGGKLWRFDFSHNGKRENIYYRQISDHITGRSPPSRRKRPLLACISALLLYTTICI